MLDFHVAVKPVSQIPNENLRCFGYKLPPALVTVEEERKTTKIEAYSAFSSEWIQQAKVWGITEYDIEIDLPHSDYLLDAELRTDFLTNRMQMKLLGLDEGTGDWHTLAVSHWVNENSFEDVSIDADQMLSTKIGDLSMVQKLRFVEDVPHEVAANASKLILRLKMNGLSVLKALESKNVINLKKDDFCFNFHLSIFIDEVG